MRHTEQRAQCFLLQKLDLHISLRRDCRLLARPLGTFLVPLSLLLSHVVFCELRSAIGVVGAALQKSSTSN
jgi:hypothetical protein